MIDPLDEQVFTLSKAARMVPSARGKCANPSTLWRWATRGVRGVRLEVVKVGGVAMTSKSALTRFFAALNEQPAPSDPTPPKVRAQRAQARLAAAGVKSAVAAMTQS